ncbi:MULTISPECIES: hypothetical protein [Delftia]|uniref:hypothetical protein n=1 Tax=Delftia TaxID=80865 RepID=UPI0003546E7C|nr:MULTISPECIES: hypothetical protein [Delftia]EPD44446.1 hypothetical protein HMPREF9701_00026 [Delftia acidovorans CCUG 274B]MDR6732312.1 hypothetical protein [Delftia lacustris]WEL96560.1 DUF2514 domain-containing protein [Delftia tsuruhatensis]
MSARIWITAALVLAAVLGLRAWNAHLVALGDAQGAERVQGQWKAADARGKQEQALAAAKAAQELAARERQAREQEQAKQRDAERIAREQANREATLRTAVSAADARNRSLHTTIAQLNADAAARLSGSAASACTAADVDAATAARNALGQCSSRYTAVAAVADGLAIQVRGLQDFVGVLQGTSTTTQRGTDGF